MKVSDLGLDGEETVQVGPMSMRSADFVSEGIPVLNVGAVQWDAIDETKVNHLPATVAEAFTRYKIEPGDVLFTRSGTVGRCAVAGDRQRGWLMTFHLLRVRVDVAKCLPQYLRMVFEGAPHIRRQACGAAVGTTRAGFNTRLLAELDVPLPPLSEQAAIVERASGLLDQIGVVDVGGLMRRSERLRIAILAAAFAGELTSQGHPDDETASVLLERIATERAAVSGSRKMTSARPRRARVTA